MRALRVPPALWVAIPCLASAPATRAQVPIVIDLKETALTGGELPAGQLFRVQIKNRLPSDRWQYVIQAIPQEQAPPPPLVSVGVLIDSMRGRLPLDGPRNVPECAQVLLAISSLDEATDEAAVPKLIEDAKPLQMNEALKKVCSGELRSLQAVFDATSHAADQSVEVPRGNNLLVVITRTERRATAKPRAWTVRYTGRPRGEWVTTYGFAFISDWPFGAANEAFHAAATSDPDEFVIRQDVTLDHVRFAPTVFFTWHPRGGKWCPSFCVALSGGLGFDLSNPVVTVGPVIVHNSNLSLHVGLVAAKADRLLSRYAVGDTVGENLTPEQLRSSVYRLNPVVALSFRFGSNPFTRPENTRDAEKNSSVSEAAGD